jgi:hypothetical protein
LRHRTWSVGTPLRELVPAALLVGGICTIALAAPMVARGLTSRDAAKWADWLKVASLDDGGVPYREGCHRGDEAGQPDCGFADKTSEKAVVLFGDSHAAHWFSAFDKAAKLEGWMLFSWSRSSCPSSNITLWNPHKRTDYEICSSWRTDMLERLRLAPRPYLVVLSNSNGYSGWTVGPDGTKGIGGRAAEDEFERGLGRTVSALLQMGHKVAIMRDTPIADPKYKDCVSAYGPDERCARAKDKASNPNNVEARVVAANPGVALIDATDLICDRKLCPVVKGAEVIYRDDSHLTTKFNETLYQPIQSLLQRTKLNRTFAAH